MCSRRTEGSERRGRGSGLSAPNYVRLRVSKHVATTVTEGAAELHLFGFGAAPYCPLICIWHQTRTDYGDGRKEGGRAQR